MCLVCWQGGGSASLVALALHIARHLPRPIPRRFQKLLVDYTPKEQLCKPERPKTITGLSLEQITQMESEMKSLQREFRLNEKKYKTDVFNHTLAIGYLRKLLQNTRIVKYLDQHHAGILSEFQRMLQES